MATHTPYMIAFEDLATSSYFQLFAASQSYDHGFQCFLLGKIDSFNVYSGCLRIALFA